MPENEELHSIDVFAIFCGQMFLEKGALVLDPASTEIHKRNSLDSHARRNGTYSTERNRLE
jgi:hypothetical protein